MGFDGVLISIYGDRVLIAWVSFRWGFDRVGSDVLWGSGFDCVGSVEIGF